MAGRTTTCAMFALRMLMKKYKEEKEGVALGYLKNTCNQMYEKSGVAKSW